MSDVLISREAQIERLRDGRVWDVLVVGGGATGLGCAVDAAARGHSTLLLEAGDFARGTSSRATKLIHGGVRYLAQGRIGLVREALAERAGLLANAPGLVRPVRFVAPTRGLVQRAVLAAGLTAYDLLAGARGIEPCRVLNQAAAYDALPGLAPGMADGGVAYWDAQFDDAGLAIGLMRTACYRGATVLNYVGVERVLHEGGRVVGVEACDAERGERFRIAARSVVNATGVWADDLRRLDEPAARARLRPSQGAHVVVDADFLPGGDALLIPKTPDGRVLFVIPWCGKRLIGTTDTPRDDRPFEPQPFDAEVDFLLDTAAHYLRHAPKRADVRSAFAGLRPLIGTERDGETAQLSREHLVETSAGGLVTITGGKWTTYRCMAEAAVDAAECAAGLASRPCVTATLHIDGASACVVAGGVVQVDAVRRAVREGQARSVEDVLARRDRLLFVDARAALDAAPAVAEALAAERGCDAAWVDRQLAAFASLARGYLVSA